MSVVFEKRRGEKKEVLIEELKEHQRLTRILLEHLSRAACSDLRQERHSACHDDEMAVAVETA